MLKNDMRKYIIAGKTYEEFYNDYHETYKSQFTDDIMQRCWKNTHKLVDRGEWLKYLKRSAAQQVGYLTMVADALQEEGVRLNDCKAGYMLNDILKKQIYGKTAEVGS